MCPFMGKGVKGGQGSGGVGFLLFMVFYLVLGARYQLGHCPVSCSTCNI